MGARVLPRTCIFFFLKLQVENIRLESHHCCSIRGYIPCREDTHVKDLNIRTDPQEDSQALESWKSPMLFAVR